MRPRFARPLTADERAELTDTFKSSKDVRLVHRCHAVLLSADGWRVPKIAELLQVDDGTVPRWYGLEQSIWTCNLLAGNRPNRPTSP